jgi:hypothetical protein
MLCDQFPVDNYPDRSDNPVMGMGHGRDAPCSGGVPAPEAPPDRLQNPQCLRFSFGSLIGVRLPWTQEGRHEADSRRRSCGAAPSGASSRSSSASSWRRSPPTRSRQRRSRGSGISLWLRTPATLRPSCKACASSAIVRARTSPLRSALRRGSASGSLPSQPSWSSCRWTSS